MTEFMEVAVYRVSIDDWGKEVDERIRPVVELYQRDFPGATGEDVQRRRRIAEGLAAGHLPYPYNQVIAWVRLETKGEGVVKENAWALPQKRIERLFVRRYEYRHKVIETWFRQSDSSDAVFNGLRNPLVALTARDGPFPRRHVDLDAFDGIGPFVDWRRLVGLRV
jgi:hypothetical protein